MTSKLIGEGDDDEEEEVQKYTLAFSAVSLDKKTKVVEHVPRIIFHVFIFSSFAKHSWFQAFV